MYGLTNAISLGIDCLCIRILYVSLSIFLIFKAACKPKLFNNCINISHSDLVKFSVQRQTTLTEVS